MNKMIAVIIGFFMPVILLGAGGEQNIAETDIVERAINFIIFFSLLYYLVADKVRNFLKQRKLDIANELEKVQIKLKESKKLKDDAEVKVEEAKKIAEDIVQTAKKESFMIAQKIEESTKNDIEILVKSYNENIEFEKRKSEKAVVSEILSDLFDSSVLDLSQSNYTDIVSKKVA